MKKYLMLFFALALGLSFTIWGCKKDKEEVNPPQENEDLKLDVNTDGAGETQKRVRYINEPLFDTVYQKKKKEAKVVAGTPMFSHVAEVASPVVNGNTLSATHVKFNGAYAYVSYHYNEPNGSAMSEDLYEGHIDVFDVSDPTTPVILSTAQKHRADFNTMFLDFESLGTQRRLWIGATDYGVGGAVFELNLIDNEIAPGTVLARYKTPPGHSVNGVVRSADWVYATAGRTAGGVFTFDQADMSLNGDLTDEFENAKYAAVSGYSAGSKHVVLRSGTSAELRIYDVSNDHSLLNTIDIGSILPETGKSGIYIKDNICWVAMGYNGLKAFDLNSGEMLYTLSPDNMEGDAVTNGVCLDDRYVYVANGSAGLYLCRIVPGQQELEVIETHDFGASANYIDVGNDLIFIANGREGLQILRRIPPGDYDVICEYDDQGVPYCLEENPYELCDDLLSHLAVALPETQNVYEHSPEFFDNPVKDLKLLEDATVYVTFIDEGAGWKNSLGTYYFPTDTPPAEVSDIIDTKLLIYPNASKEGDGGALLAGATMRLLGSYPAGTTIGSFLVAQGWDTSMPGNLSEGYYTHYTNPNLNSNEIQQTLLFYDASCDAIVLTFEDIKIPSGDKDYNDCMFQIIVDPPTAVNTDELIQIGE